MNKNIYEYLNYYKDYTFDDILFNQMDALVFSMIIYAPFKDTKNTSSIQNLYKQNIHAVIVNSATIGRVHPIRKRIIGI